MLARYRQHHPGSSIAQLLFFDACRECALFVLVLFFRLKRVGIHHVPPRGPVLIVANHQSFLDPPVIATGIRSRQSDFLARGGLFKFKPFGWIITKLNTTPIKQGAGDSGAMKLVLQKLKDGKLMIVFPEGSRTCDGQMLEFQRGIGVLLKRADCQVVPVGISGAFDAWPRTRKLPRLFTKKIVVCYGQPISSEELMANGTDDALETLEQRVHELVDQAQSYRK